LADRIDIDWETCAEGGCVGVQLPSGDRCWAHADGHDVDTALDRVRAGDDLDGRGVVFTSGLLERVLDAVPIDDGRTVVTDALFDGAAFEGFTDFGVTKFESDASFVGATFLSDAHFEGATFAGYTDFEGAKFESDSTFVGATFAGYTDFDGTTFAGDTTFQGASFEVDAEFSDATFSGPAVFEGATFTGNTPFDGATFEHDGGFEGATFTGNASFVDATFKGGADFTEVTFTGDAQFDRAAFEGDARFGQTTFRKPAGFAGATFKRKAEFTYATFEGDAWFRGATVEGDAQFFNVTFKGAGRFDNVIFTGNAFFVGASFTGSTLWGSAVFLGANFTHGAQFVRATFTGDARFDKTTFGDHVSFIEATFGGKATFAGATVEGEARFLDVTFERVRQLGPMVVRKSLVLDGALFHERIRIEVSAAVLTCKRARFLAGVQLRVRWAEVVLDGADLAAPSILSSANAFPGLDEAGWPRPPESSWPVDPYGTPRLLSVRGADVAGLTVAGVDLRACRFVDAHHLDQLRAEASNLPNTPPGWRWTKRRTIAEEHQWRASEDAQGWYEPENQPPDWLEVRELVTGDAGLLLPGRIAPLYRDLRKGLEDKKDEPGAADFYYGEMEMRRHDKRGAVHLERTLRFRNGGFGISAAAEYAILSLYWLVSGYGLRAWRAFASLAAVVLVASVIFAFWGFDRKSGLDELPSALLFSTQATTALLRGPDPRALTTVGEWQLIALRLIGPVLLGLAVLSVRGRVKR
jgi:uncharacterized protein YjbI with pentapeptide repeats